MTTSRPGFADYGLLLLLSAIWGSSFLFIKVAVETLPALSMTAARLTLSVLILFAMAALAKEGLPRGLKTWGWIALAGLFGNALPFGLIAWGEERIDSGLAAILMSHMPLTTMVLAHIFTADEKLTLPKLAASECVPEHGVVRFDRVFLGHEHSVVIALDFL